MLEQFGNMMEMVKKIQQNVEDVQSRLKDERVEVSTGDVIKITMNGQQEVVSIELNSKYLSAENATLLQDLLAATVNNALTKSRELNQVAMNKLAGDLNLPKIPGLF
ncbi:Nucleoid-associated protein [bioreactor metagenome]|uniref:Nucleoid-associated protein n=1 Tax=bioreactor metagenome TaxID=1076179 RepID=A0A644YTJ6_9ZZZZ